MGEGAEWEGRKEGRNGEVTKGGGMKTIEGKERGEGRG